MTQKKVRDNTEPSGIRMTSIRFTIADEIMIEKIKDTYGLKNMTDVIRLGLAITATGVLPKQRVRVSSEVIRQVIDLLQDEEIHSRISNEMIRQIAGLLESEISVRISSETIRQIVHLLAEDEKSKGRT